MDLNLPILQIPDETLGAIIYFVVIPLNFVLVVVALLDITRRPAWQLSLVARAIWGLVIFLIWLVGPAAYLIWRRRLPAANIASPPRPSKRRRRQVERKRR